MMAKTNKEPIRSVKGMHDILPDLVPYYDRVIRETRRVAEFYGFQTIRTPHVELRDLFDTSLGETSDVVEKQMYAFRTRGGSQVVLRPEGTAAIMRAYFEHGMASWPQPVKLYYSGSFFRHENPQAGRLREFQSAGVEILGDNDPVNDALVIRIMISALESLRVPNVMVHINSIGDKASRQSYLKELSLYYRKRQHALCKDCKRRQKDNPMRLLDCKNPECLLLKREAPQIMDYLNDESKKHFQAVLEFLDEMDIAYMLDPFLVRGLDYYSHTVFEFFVEHHDGEIASDSSTPSEHAEGEEDVQTTPTPDQNEPSTPEIVETEQVEEEEPAQNGAIAIGGGGRYDSLAEMLYGKPLPAVGAGLGVDRIVLEMRRRGLKVRPEVNPKIFIVQLGPQAKKKALLITEELRKNGIPCAHSLSRDDLRKQLKIADRLGTPFALIIGQKEAIEERAILRSMATGSQEAVPFPKIVSVLKMRLKQL